MAEILPAQDAGRTARDWIWLGWRSARRSLLPVELASLHPEWDRSGCTAKSVGGSRMEKPYARTFPRTAQSIESDNGHSELK